MDNFTDFQKQIRAIEQAIPLAHRDAQVALLIAGYDAAIQGTPVRTGALRAENIVVEGDPSSPSGILYESPERPGPDTVVPSRVSEFAGGEATQFAPPSPEAARAASADINPYGVVGVLNQRFYAGSVHATRPWMDLARDVVEKLSHTVRLRDPSFE